MTGEYAEDIGGLKANSKRNGTNIDSLFASNEKRKQEINGLKGDIQSVQHTVDETNQVVNGVAESMERLREDVKDAVNTINSVNGYVKDIDKRVTELEASKFDTVKIVRWLGTTRGVIFMVIMSAMLIGSFDPGARQFILEFIGLATKAGIK